MGPLSQRYLGHLGALASAVRRQKIYLCPSATLRSDLFATLLPEGCLPHCAAELRLP